MAYTDYNDLPEPIQGKLEKWGYTISPTSTRDAQILIAANRAQSKIHSMLASRYGSSLPFTNVPQVISDISLDITIYYLASVQQVVGIAYENDYNNALELLKMYADGELDLFDSNTGALAAEFDSEYGSLSDYGETYDDDDDDYRQYPRTLLGEPPSTYEKTYREED